MTHLLFALLIAGLTIQPASHAGTWVAELKGLTFVRLEVKTVNGRLTGALATGDIQFDTNGVVNGAKSAPTALTPMDNITISRDVMSFTRIEGSDTERFQMRVTAEGRAELTFLPSDEDLEELKEAGIPPPKPIPLRKLR